MKIRPLFSWLGILIAGLAVTGQAAPVLPAAAASIADTKLTDPLRIKQSLTNPTVNVIVTLAAPAALRQADFSSPTALAAARPHVKKLQQDVLAALPAGEVKPGFQFDNIAGFAAEVTPAGLKALQAHAQVVAIEPVFLLEPHLAQGIPLLGGMTYRSTYNGAGLAIAICDTGVDYTHARLGGGGFPNSKVIGGYDYGDGDADPMPNGEAHGTCCAGIAAGDLGTVGDYIGGVAYNAKIYALKISAGSASDATTAAMVAAWDWCVTHRNDDPANPIMVISTSFGGGQYFSACDSTTPAMTTAANNAVAAGITVLASSGNDGYCDSLSWPSCISSVISVGAVYDANFGNYTPCVAAASCAPKIADSGCTSGYYVNDATAADKVTAYANVASFLTLFAPANDCYTLDITGTSGYSTGDYDPNFGGTSAACPYAAGAVACLQSAAKAITGSYLTPAEVKHRLLNTGNNVTDTKIAVTKPRINLAAAIQTISTNPVLNHVSATLAGGNGDQSVAPDECNQLHLVVRNDGVSAATNVTATLTTTTPGVTVFQPNSAYPNLAPAANGTNVTAFKISTTPAFVCGTAVNLTLTLNYGGGAATNPFTLVSGLTNYTITPTAGASIVTATSDTGNHGDDDVTAITLPFAYTFYGQTFSTATVDSNGNLQFTSATSAYANACLPATGLNNVIFPHWDDLRTDGNLTTLGTQGIYTSTSGAAPNRIFNIEWRASYYKANKNGNPLNFEIRLYENQNRFDLIYGTLNGTGSSATAGAQKNTGESFAQFSCAAAGLSNSLQLTFWQGCPEGGGACVAPVADFAGSPANGAAPLTVAFTNTSTGASSYGWNFGDGQTSSAANPVNTYTNAGSYTVTLTANGTESTNTLTRTNYIGVTNPPPPLLAVAPASLTFARLAPGATAQAAFVISNAGGSPLTGAATGWSAPFAPTNSGAFNLPAAMTTNLFITFAPASAGVFSNQVVFASNGGGATNAIAGECLGAVPLRSLTWSDEVLRVAFDSVAGFAYELQFKDSLTDTNWQTLQTVAGNGLMQTLSNAAPATPQRFFRLRAP